MIGGYCAAGVLKSPPTWDTSSRWTQEGAVLCQPRSQGRLGSEAAVPWFTRLWKDVWRGCKQVMLILYCLLTYQINIWPVRKCHGYRPQHSHDPIKKKKFSCHYLSRKIPSFAVRATLVHSSEACAFLSCGARGQISAFKDVWTWMMEDCVTGQGGSLGY